MNKEVGNHFDFKGLGASLE
nr:hypothetical protein [Nitrosomonas sp. Nm132]